MRMEPSTMPTSLANAQLFWATTQKGFNEAASLRFYAWADDEYHTYRFDLSRHPQWGGVITQLED